jgi:heat shock protein HslJ
LAFQSPSYAADLKGNWKLESLGGVPVLPSTKITAEFENGSHGSISGSGGCNRYFGTGFTANPYQAIVPLTARNSGRITTVGGGITLKLCGEFIDNQESSYFRALDSTTSYNVSDQNLELIFDSDKSLKYVKAE